MQISGHLPYLLWTLYILYRGVSVSSSFQGKEFLLAFPSSFPTNSSFEQRLSIANSGDLDASINITMIKNSTVLLFQQKSLGVGQGCFGNCVIESLTSNPYRHGGILVRISSTSRIVVLAHSTSVGSDYDSFLVLPTANLSLVYNLLAECPGSFCVLIVASAVMKVNVTITFCLVSQTTSASLTYNNVTYFHGSSMTATLNPWQTLEIVTDGVSLGGSLVQSSGKIAVVSGTLTLSNGVIGDFNVEAVAPRDQLGTEYVVVDCPTCGTTSYVKVVYNEPNTTLAIDNKSLALKAKRDCIEYYALKQQSSAIIRSDKPILVQLMYSEDNVIVTPTKNWGTYYVTVPSSHSRVVLITRSDCSSEFSFNSVVDNGLSWALIGDGSFKYAAASLVNYGTWLNVSALNCTFSGIVYTSAKPTMLWSLGWGPDYVVPRTNSVTINTIADGSTIMQSSTESTSIGSLNSTTAVTTTSLTTASTVTNSSATETISPTSLTTASTVANSSATETISLTSLTTAPTVTNSSATETISPTSLTTASTVANSSARETASPTSTTVTTATNSFALETASPTTSSTSTVTAISIGETTPSASTVIPTSATKSAAVSDNFTADGSTSSTTSYTSTLSTILLHTTSLNSMPISGRATATNSTVPIPDGFVCPCTCSYASIQPSFWKYLRQKENTTRDVIERLRIIAHAQSAQKMLKISMENDSMSETVVGATVFILLMAVALAVMFAPDLTRIASCVIQQLRIWNAKL